MFQSNVFDYQLKQLRGWLERNPLLACAGAAGFCLLLYWIISSSSGGPAKLDLRVEKFSRQNANGKYYVVITNIGTDQTEVNGFTFNNDVECLVPPMIAEIDPAKVAQHASDPRGTSHGPLGEITMRPLLPIKLHVGQAIEAVNKPECGDIIRIEVATDRGTATYTWN